MERFKHCLLGHGELHTTLVESHPAKTREPLPENELRFGGFDFLAELFCLAFFGTAAGGLARPKQRSFELEPGDPKPGLLVRADIEDLAERERECEAIGIIGQNKGAGIVLKREFGNTQRGAELDPGDEPAPEGQAIRLTPSLFNLEIQKSELQGVCG